MIHDILPYTCAATLEAFVTHPLEITRIRYVNRTTLWRGIRGLYPGFGIQLLGMIPSRTAFIGTKDYAVTKGLRWWEYSPLSAALQTLVEGPFQSWKTARAEQIPIRARPSGITPMYARNLIFACGLFGVSEGRLVCNKRHPIVTTAIGVSIGVIASHPFDVVRIAKQSIHRDLSYHQIICNLYETGRHKGHGKTLWRGCAGRLVVTCVGITTMIESMRFFKLRLG